MVSLVSNENGIVDALHRSTRVLASIEPTLQLWSFEQSFIDLDLWVSDRSSAHPIRVQALSCESALSVCLNFAACVSVNYGSLKSSSSKHASRTITAAFEMLFRCISMHQHPHFALPIQVDGSTEVPNPVRCSCSEIAPVGNVHSLFPALPDLIPRCLGILAHIVSMPALASGSAAPEPPVHSLHPMQASPVRRSKSMEHFALQLVVSAPSGRLHDCPV